MKEKVKTICLALITLSLLTGTGFYCWQVYKTQLHYQLEEQKDQLEEQKDLEIHRECIETLKGWKGIQKGYVPLTDQLDFYKKCVKRIEEVGGVENYKEILPTN